MRPAVQPLVKCCCLNLGSTIHTSLNWICHWLGKRQQLLIGGSWSSQAEEELKVTRTRPPAYCQALSGSDGTEAGSPRHTPPQAGDPGRGSSWRPKFPGPTLGFLAQSPLFLTCCLHPLQVGMASADLSNCLCWLLGAKSSGPVAFWDYGLQWLVLFILVTKMQWDFSVLMGKCPWTDQNGPLVHSSLPAWASRPCPFMVSPLLSAHFLFCHFHQMMWELMSEVPC